VSWFDLHAQNATDSCAVFQQVFGRREYDSETGLYYYRARYYEPKFGRFIGEDPIRFDGGMNFYAYVGNNPVTYTDSTGLWPTKKIPGVNVTPHQASIGRVLAFLSTEDRRVLQQQQVIADADQSTQGSYKHAMRAEFQPESAARALANTYLRQEIEAAQKRSCEGDRRGALEHMGNVIHILQDATSPSHRGFQIWRGVINLNQGAIHLQNENFDPGPGSNLDAATRKAWNYFLTPRAFLPKDFF
jgi:RHS repeat-associated protein